MKQPEILDRQFNTVCKNANSGLQSSGKVGTEVQADMDLMSLKFQLVIIEQNERIIELLTVKHAAETPDDHYCTCQVETSADRIETYLVVGTFQTIMPVLRKMGEPLSIDWVGSAKFHEYKTSGDWAVLEIEG